MHPNIHEDTLRRGREELQQRAAYERMVGQAMFKQGMNQKFHHKAANWLGIHLVSWGEKLEQFGTFAERQPTRMTTTSPHH